VLLGASEIPIFVFVKFLQESRMLKKAAALFLVCASMATWIGCGSTSSKYLYAAIPVTNQIVIFREDPNSGVLTQLAGSPVTAGQAVQALAMHPSGKFLYAANSGEGDVSLYTISTAGALTEVTPRTQVGVSPQLLAMDSAGAFLYVGNTGSFNISVFSISASTGALAPVPGSPFPMGVSPINMALSPSGNVLYVTGGGSLSTSGNVQAFSVVQGVPQAPGISGSPFLTGVSPYGLAIAPGGGFLYTGNNFDNSISEFTINADGSLTQLASSPFGTQFGGPVALQTDKSGKYLYVANQASSNLAGYSIGSDGSLIALSSSPFGTAANPSTLAIDSNGKYLFVGNEKSPVIQSFSLATSGTLTSIASYGVPGTPTSIVTQH
jgi:6-phosphogluconolactonase (cycloisomerase 2 family)